MTAAPLTTRADPACSTVDPELFFGPDDSAVAGAMFAWERRAVAVCTGCPVGAQCLAAALEFPADEQYGVIGAMTAAQRRALLRASGQRPTRTAIAQDAPAQAVALHEAGVGPRAIARQLGVGERRVHRWLQRHRAGQQPISHRPKRVSA
jgi:WhiB family redox-sensing transcriptional regulator